MSTTSKKYFPEDFSKKIWEELLSSLKKSNTKDSVLKNLKGILTTDELNNVEKRLAVRYLLNQGLSYRQISEIADVSRTTVKFIKGGYVKKEKAPPQKSAKNKQTRTEAAIDFFGIGKGGSDLLRYRFTPKRRRQ